MADETPNYVFDEKPFPTIENVDIYIALQQEEAANTRKQWFEVFQKKPKENPIQQLSDALEIAFKEDLIRNQNPNPWEIHPESNFKVRKVRISMDEEHDKDLDESLDLIDITEVRLIDTDELSRIDIRMKYPESVNESAPPWEQEVYSLVMRPPRPTAQEISALSEDNVNYTPLDRKIDLPNKPELIIQPSKEFNSWLKKSNSPTPPIIHGSQVFTDPEIAKKVLVHGVNQVSQALHGFHICESYEPTNFDPNSQTVTLKDLASGKLPNKQLPNQTTK